MHRHSVVSCGLRPAEKRNQYQTYLHNAVSPSRLSVGVIYYLE